MAKRWNEKSFAHKMVAELQVEMAHEVYDIKCLDNAFYKQWPTATEFVNAVAPTLRAEARKVLSELLSRHDVSAHDKEEIYQALLLDAVVPNEDRFHVGSSLIQ